MGTKILWSFHKRLISIRIVQSKVLSFHPAKMTINHCKFLVHHTKIYTSWFGKRFGLITRNIIVLFFGQIICWLFILEDGSKFNLIVKNFVLQGKMYKNKNWLQLQYCNQTSYCLEKQIIIWNDQSHHFREIIPQQCHCTWYSK